MRQVAFKPRFEQFIPEKLAEGVLYVSMEYATLSHLCACGCGREVVTPLSPTDWQLHFDGEAISLHPSIGNWSFPCRSHYFIRKNKIAWSSDMSQRDIDRGRLRDKAAKQQHFGQRSTASEQSSVSSIIEFEVGESKPASSIRRSTPRWWQSLFSVFRR